jgi:hypothetical protein
MDAGGVVMGRRAKHSRADHRAAAAGLREMPGVELLVGTYRAGSLSPDGMVHAVQKGLHGYTPAGSFEARTEPVGDETGLYVRYIGQPAEVTS